MRLASDVETNGLLDSLTKLHCIVNIDIDSYKVYRYGPHGMANTVGLPIEGVEQLQSAEEVVFHNGIQFDIPAIIKTTGIDLRESLGERLRDSLVESRLVFSNIKDLDFNKYVKQGLPTKLIGRHSLESWGYRLGILKGDFGQTADWQVCTPEMIDYCEQDVRVTVELVKLLDAQGYSKDAIRLEHEVAWLLAQQERNGFCFDEKAAIALYAEISDERSRYEAELKSIFGGWYAINKTSATDIITSKAGRSYRCKKPKRTINAKFGSRALSTLKDRPYTPIKWVDFNPTSRQHIIKILLAKGWAPTEFTKGGEVKVDEDVLLKLPYPEAKQFARLFMLQKRVGQIAEGDKAWLKYVQREPLGVFIHGSVNPMGTVTHRASHSYPNIGQVPACDAEYGKECRQLFTVPTGWTLFGSDASGLELRCLGHFMAKWDNGDYVKVILEGDIHTANQEAAGLPTRSMAKTFIYAFLYGGGDEKIGSITDPQQKPSFQRKKGKALKTKFLNNLPALKNLKEAVEAVVKRGYIKGLDGRKVYIRHKHAALNTLLQSAGALICKDWIVNIERLALKAGLVHDWKGDFAFCAWVHDEVQIACRTKEVAEQLGAICQEAMKITERNFNFRCPLDTDFSIGPTWVETH